MTTILTHTIAALSGICFGMWVTYWIFYATTKQNKKQPPIMGFKK